MIIQTDAGLTNCGAGEQSTPATLVVSQPAVVFSPGLAYLRRTDKLDLILLTAHSCSPSEKHG
jgi:hypothetical protein